MTKPLPITVTILGATDSGKTALIKRLIENTFVESKEAGNEDFVCFYSSYFFNALISMKNKKCYI